ncbi:MAG: SapC family protein [Asticcacaulis sp.]
MGQHVLLNNVDHHDLRLITRHGAAFGDAVNQTLVLPTEYQDIQRHYPIFFRQTESGGLKSVALLGFDRDENLFLDGDRWNAAYVPAMHRVTPFLIGQPKAAPGKDLPPDAEAMILIDPAHARISRSEGEPLFLPHGGNSPGLTQMISVLQQVYAGEKVSEPMFAAFYEAGLLAPVEIEVKIDDRQSVVLKDMLSISREALQNLDGERLKALNAAGFLALAFLVVSSLGNLSHMITLKNLRAKAAV